MAPTTLAPAPDAHPAPAFPRAEAPPRTRSQRREIRPDIVAACVIGGAIALLLALTWRKWGTPELDSGAELTTADLVAHGAMPYRDVRYYYGPLGIYELAGAFKVLGSSFAVAWALGIAHVGLIAGTFYRLARTWLRPTVATLGTLMLLSLAFSGTGYDYVLPHTSSATLGILFVLALLLALAHERRGLAGVAAGLVFLTRPEFAAVAVGTIAAYGLGTWRDRGPREGIGAVAAVLVPAVLIAAAVLGVLASEVGAARLFTENLWPVDFIRASGFKSQADWLPLTPASFVALGARALVYCGALAAIVVAVDRGRRGHGTARVLAAGVPVAVFALGLLALYGASDAIGILAAERHDIRHECRSLLIGVSWLPALGFAAAGFAAARFVRGRRAPLSGSWALDLPLIATAAALGLRAYAQFTPEGSYAAYYAPPLVLMAAILHERLGDLRPAARPALNVALGGVALGLALYALIGLYADKTTPVDTPRGAFVADNRAAPALQRAVDWLDAHSRPGEHVLAAPADGGLYFMADRPPALYDITILPGSLDSRADERHAIHRLRTRDVRAAVVSSRDFSDFGAHTFGRDYNALLGRWIARSTRHRERVGDPRDRATGSYPSRAFSLLTLSARARAKETRRTGS